MLFPGLKTLNLSSVVGLLVGVGLTGLLLGVIAWNQGGDLVAVATATPTKTATAPPTATFTPTPTPSNTPTPTATPTPSNTPTATPTSTSTPTSTPLPPTWTPTPLPPTATPVPVAEAQPVEAPAGEPVTSTLSLTGSVTLTGTGVITPVGTPTVTPTPVPRTVLVPAGAPEAVSGVDHLWFGRPFAAGTNGWGSYYYPYGTNAGGQYYWHRGIDIQNPHGTTVVAIGPGTVIHAGPDVQNILGPWPDFYGQAVVIEHSDTWNGQPVYTLYGHVSRVLVQRNQAVEAGQPIAEVGQLGVAIGPHLHLEVRVGAGSYSDTRNPDLWVAPDSGFGVIAGRVVDHQGYFVPQQLVTLHRGDDSARFWRQTFTYPDNIVNYDENYLENFTFSDVPEGEYYLKTYFDGHQLTVPVTVREGATSFVLLHQRNPPIVRPQVSAPTETATPVEPPEQ